MLNQRYPMDSTSRLWSSKPSVGSPPDRLALGAYMDGVRGDTLTGTLASTVAANGWAGLPAPIPSGSLGGFDGILLQDLR